MTKKRVFLVDDHAISRMGLRRLIEFESDLMVCGEAGLAEDCLKLLPSAKPDILIVDLGLPDMGGLELIKVINRKYPKMLVLVVSMHDEAVYAERSFKAGAKGYLMKKESAEKIVGALRDVLSGKRHMSESLKEKILDRVATGKSSEDHSPVEDLSDRELEVFEFIGQGLKTGQIAEKLHLSVKTIESYREQVKIKLHLETASELTQYAIQWSRTQES